MGTRGLTVVIKNGKKVVSQYGQWDHYPKGQGLYILLFLSNILNIIRLRKAVENLSYITTEQLNDYRNDIPETLSRDTGAKILSLIANGTTQPLYLINKFPCCEGVFTVDLDKEEFTTKYHGITSTFSFNYLPSEEEYLSSFKVVQCQ